MSKPNPADRVYTREHEWVKDAGDGTATIGITDYAQEMLTDIVFVELPASGARFTQGQPMAVVESVKSVSDVYAPVAGEIVAVNDALEGAPERINTDVFGEGWMVKMKLDDAHELATLMSASAYEDFLKQEKS